MSNNKFDEFLANCETAEDLMDLGFEPEHKGFFESSQDEEMDQAIAKPASKKEEKDWWWEAEMRRQRLGLTL